MVNSHSQSTRCCPPQETHLSEEAPEWGRPLSREPPASVLSERRLYQETERFSSGYFWGGGIMSDLYFLLCTYLYFWYWKNLTLIIEKAIHVIFQKGNNQNNLTSRGRKKINLGPESSPSHTPISCCGWSRRFSLLDCWCHKPYLQPKRVRTTPHGSSCCGADTAGLSDLHHWPRSSFEEVENGEMTKAFPVITQHLWWLGGVYTYFWMLCCFWAWERK